MENESKSVNDILWHTDSFWTSSDTSKIITALVKFHGSGITVPKNGLADVTRDGTVKRKYMLLDDILTAVRPALAQVGCYMEQHLAGDSVITRISHESGQFIASKMHYVTWEGGAVNNLMKMGGGLSYLRRYAAAAILALPADEDTDAAGVDHMAHKPSSQAKTTGSAKTGEQLPWLNLTDKSGAFTEAGGKAWEYIEKGGRVTDILKKYRLNKTDKAKLEELESNVESAYHESVRQTANIEDNDGAIY